MALDLARVIEVLQKQYTPHVYRYENHVVASLLVESGSPNYVFVALLRCDTQNMVVEKIECPSRYHSDSPIRVPPTYTAEQRTLMERQCLRCHETIYAEDTYCPYCGTNYAKFRKQMEGKPL